ncbi:MAG TPA: hypothetical protein VGE56_06485 [Rhodocyclaceae bacterium]
MKIKLIGAIAIALLTSACATVEHKPMTKEASEALRERSLIQSQYEKADFVAFTAGKAAFAMLGAVAAISEGNEIVTENDIADPAIAISKGLADKLTSTRSVKTVSSQIVAKSDSLDDLVKTYIGADYILDIKTFGWMFLYYPTDWSHYKVQYSARLRLIDTSTKQVIAETMCQTVQGDDKNPPTKDQLLENKASLLKSYLSKATDGCIEVLSKDVLML